MPEVTIQDNHDGTYLCQYSTSLKGNLQVFIGIKGREIPDCPFEVVSDVKVRRKVAQEKLSKMAGKVDVAAKKKEEAMLRQQGKKVPTKSEQEAKEAKEAEEALAKKTEEEEYEEPEPEEAVALPARGQKITEEPKK